MSTGFPDADARDDFNRVQRQRALARLRYLLGRRTTGGEDILVFEDVVRVLGRLGQRSLGLRAVPLDAVVGTVDRDRGFDRQFRPLASHSRQRWERIAAAVRRGESLPPVDVYKVGGLYFVRDGHHRVSVARALGITSLDGYVTEILTAEPAPPPDAVTDLTLLDHRRICRHRVPLPPERWERIKLSDPWDYALLAEGVEAWAYRRCQEAGELMEPARVAVMWFDEEYAPVVDALRDAGLIGDGTTETEAYLRLGAERYKLFQTHTWTEDVIERLRHLRSRRASG